MIGLYYLLVFWSIYTTIICKKQAHVLCVAIVNFSHPFTFIETGLIKIFKCASEKGQLTKEVQMAWRVNVVIIM
jgi:hypothetical protein